MRRFLSIILAALIISGGVFSPASAAPKPVKSNFTKMSDLLASFKVKGVTCSPYTKTPAELVIEEGKCRFQGSDILIDLWPKEKTAKDIADAMRKVAAYYIETDFWPAGSKMFIFSSNNYTLLIDGLAPEIKKAKKVANVLQERLGIKYTIGTGKKIGSKVKNESLNPLPTPSKTPAPPLKGTWTKPFGWDGTITYQGFKLSLTSFETKITEKLCKAKYELERATPDDNDLIVSGEICPQAYEGKFNAGKAELDEYAVLNVKYKNETQEIGYPGLFTFFFKVADAQGRIFETVLLTYEDSKSMSIDAVPGATVSTSVYFQLPKNFISEGSKIEVSTGWEKFYWAIEP